MSVADEITPTIKPGDDFNRYVNQRWLEANPIPANKARYGAFGELTDQNMERLKGLLEQPSVSDEAANLTLLKSYYRTAMDEADIEQYSPKIVADVASEVAALSDAASILDYITKIHASGQELLWTPFVDLDDKDSRRYVLRFAQGGLGLPDRDYYLEDSERFTEILAKYQAFLTSLFELLGQDDAQGRAKGVIQLETSLAEASMTATERRDPDATYNLFTPDSLAAAYPRVNWTQYFAAQGFGEAREVCISQTAFLTAALDLTAATAVSIWQDYLLVHTLLPIMNKLGRAFEDLAFDFYGRTLRGATEMEPRYRRIIGALMQILPEPTGQLFVETYFDESAKATIYDLVTHLQAAFKVRLANLPWMSDETKAKAAAKLATFLPLLGYPDKWRAYDGVNLTGSYVTDARALERFEWQRVVNRIDQPVDRREWLMSPVLVNAYYWPNTNGITFPAGILQPPFFDAGGDFAANYGSIGGIIGHELTHGFDDEGSKFDPDGNLKSWWTEADRKAFEERAARLVAQYNSYEVNGRHVNGELTLGENIADLGGIQVAYDALQAKLAELGKKDKVDGLTPEQRFFAGYAISWRENIRPELSLQYLVSDPHSPDQFRTNGIVRNLDAFYDAFGVEAGDKLYLAPDERVRIW
ncbi:M13 family metallopeptidase [Candidatus Saccharibacteria bacterium]|nr:M13 family metallopeptidase [Candidatus Saccharibacteria bacterium]